MDGDGALRGFSFAGYRELRDTGSYQPVDLAELCQLLPRLEPGAVVYTSDDTLPASIQASCDVTDTTVKIIGG